MAEDVESVVLEILKRIQADIADLRGDVSSFRGDMKNEFAAVGGRLCTVEGRLSAVEDPLKRQRRDIAGILFIAKSAVGDLVLQIEAIERRTAALEAAGG